MLLSMRAGEGPCILTRRSPQQNTVLGPSQEPTCGCRKRARRSAPCFRPVLYRELCNCSACRGYGSRIPAAIFLAASASGSVGTTRWGERGSNLRVEKRASIFLINRNLQETAQRERVNCQRPGHRAADWVCPLSPFAEGWVRGLQNYRDPAPLTPVPPYRRGGRPSSPQPSSLPGSTGNPSSSQNVFRSMMDPRVKPAGDGSRRSSLTPVSCPARSQACADCVNLSALPGIHVLLSSSAKDRMGRANSSGSCRRARQHIRDQLLFCASVTPLTHHCS